MFIFILIHSFKWHIELAGNFHDSQHSWWHLCGPWSPWGVYSTPVHSEATSSLGHGWLSSISDGDFPLLQQQKHQQQLINWHMGIFMLSLNFGAEIFHSLVETLERGFNEAILKCSHGSQAVASTGLGLWPLLNGPGMSAAHKFLC
ncbi:uncharacterized protein LOC133850529 [Drosophila sulfurigaster albostrigata]|uniref:uncharacterized protein LOC133850529 n=1 Tax=Drosophila sulfurigaster albostrigata TaxID=89887 RepID=UPI002D21E5A7|nr:uncharacterized protein LOC133850529 [Drosophila sulfurigaster albostrigata]